MKFSHIWIYEITKSIDKPNCVNKIGTSKSVDAAHVRTSVTSRPSHTII